MRRRKPRAYGTPVSIEGNPWTYRRPLLQLGRWRVDRRDRKTGEVERIKLDVPADASYTTALKKVAEMAAEERATLGEPGAPLPERPEGVQLGEALDAWLKVISCDVRPATAKDYGLCVSLYKRALGGESKPLREIALSGVEAPFSSRNGDADPPGWANRTGKTKAKHKAMLTRFYGWCVKHHYVDENLGAAVERPKAWGVAIRKANRESGQALSIEEARKLLTKAREKFQVNFTPEKYRSDENELTDLKPTEELWLYIFLALSTGLRVSNLLPSTASGKPGLAWRHINLEERTLRIEPELMKGGDLLYVPLRDEVVEVLQARLRKMGRVPHPDDPVIGEFQEMRRSFQRALTRAGLGDRGFRHHDLRHTFAAWAGEHCTNAVVKALLGHAKTEITDRYTKHLSIDAIRKQLNRIPRLLSPRAPRILDAAKG